MGPNAERFQKLMWGLEAQTTSVRSGCRHGGPMSGSGNSEVSTRSLRFPCHKEETGSPQL
jgi:hypothetical protein